MRNKRTFSVLGAGLLGLFASSTAQAAPELRVQVSQRGDFVLLGNTLGHDCSTTDPLPAPVVGTVGACGTNVDDSSADVFWRSDSAADGQAEANTGVTMANARSTAVLKLPPGAVVTHAYLYWSASLAATGDDQTVTFERAGAGGFSSAVNAITAKRATFDGHAGYQSVADVTALVKANGAGAYRVSGVTSENFINLSKETSFAGWWMAVFYELATDPPRNLALFDAFDVVDNGTATANLSGFTVPNAGFDGKLGVVAYEGDDKYPGDSLRFNGTALTNAHNPANNFFNATRSTLGALVSNAGDLPQLTGAARSMSGMDLDVVDVTALLTAGQTTAPIVAASTGAVGDTFILGGFITSISTFKPDFTTSTKNVTDVNGGSLVAGDILEYTIVAKNTGNDASINTVLSDPLPAGVTYVPGSLKITAGANSGAKTDAAGDDQADYNAATRTVTFRLGAGANGASGGKMAIDETTTLTLQVKVDVGATGTIANQATITAAGDLGAPSSTANTDGNGAGAGAPTTDIVVDACSAPGVGCAAPTPACKTTAHPYVCVECVGNGDCTGLKPTCDVATNTCSCVASGAEVCDGKDNDCDGTIDEGFPAICVECTDDSDCGNATSGRVCNDTTKVCVDGCRGKNGNGCPTGDECSSTTSVIGICKDASGSDAGADGGSKDGGSGNNDAGNGNGNGNGNGSGDAGTTGAEAGAIPDDDLVASGNGLLCTARPGTTAGSGLAWILGSVGAVIAGLRRRRRRG